MNQDIYHSKKALVLLLVGIKLRFPALPAHGAKISTFFMNKMVTIAIFMLHNLFTAAYEKQILRNKTH